jgi:ribose-phosphate pyrophosphokinase
VSSLIAAEQPISIAAPQPIRGMDPDRIKVFSGRANEPLAAEMCSYLGLPLSNVRIKQFSDGEIDLQLGENVRGADVFIVQPTCTPVDRNLLELLLMIDAVKLSSAERITVVLPYYGYGRQDRKDKPRVPISAKLVAKILESAGASRIMALDLHAAQIQGFFDIPVDHLYFRPVLIDYYRRLNLPKLTVVSPDAGGVERARGMAKRLNTRLAIIDKRREEANVAEIMNVIGDVVDAHCLVVDDLIDTAGTLVGVTEALLSKGAASVTAAATHAVLSGPAVERIEKSALREVVCSNSIPLSEAARNSSKIRTLSVGPLLARAIQSIHEETSISVLFENVE